MNNNPLYNSRIIRTFVEYLRKHYPEVVIDSVLTSAGMTASEIQDGAYWFTQTQVDRFNETVAVKTGNPNVAREAGRFFSVYRRSGCCKTIYIRLNEPEFHLYVNGKALSPAESGC